MSTLLALLLLSVSISAEAETYEVTSSSSAAAANPTYTVTIDGVQDDLSMFIIKFPEGVTFTARGSSLCTEEQFSQRDESQAGDCSGDTLFGSASTGDLDSGARSDIREQIIDNCGDYLDTSTCLAPNSWIRAGINSALNDYNNLSGKIYLGESNDPRSPAKARLFVEIEIPSGDSDVDAGDVAERLGHEFPGDFIKFSCNMLVRSVPYIGYGRHALDRDVVVTDIPDGGTSVACRVPHQYMWLVESMSLTLQESGGHLSRSAITNPTVCGDADFHATFFRLNSPDLRDISPGNQLSTTSCADTLRFGPSVSVSTQAARDGVPSQLTARITQAYESDGVATGEAHLKNATLAYSGSHHIKFIDNMVWCQPVSSIVEPICPAEAKIGEVEIESPLFDEPSRGNIYLLYPNILFARIHTVMFAYGKAPFRLTADLLPRRDGFEIRVLDLPQVPISQLKIVLDSGDRGLIAISDPCERGAIDARFRSHGGLEHNVQYVAQVGCNGNAGGAQEKPRGASDHKRAKSSDARNPERADAGSRKKARSTAHSRHRRTKVHSFT